MYLILDIGGTKTRVGLVNHEYKLLETSLMLTEKEYLEGISGIFNYIRSKDIRISKICLGIAGILDEGKLFYSPNLKGWVGKDIVTDLKKEFAAEVYSENDAALAGLGEALYGAGKESKIVGYLTIGTGIGGVRIVNGNIDTKIFGFEPGHQIIASGLDPNQRKKSKEKMKEKCGNTIRSSSTFEGIASGKSIKRIYGDSPENISDKETWKKIIKNIASGVANTIFYWAPEKIILGGGVGCSEYLDLSILKEETEKIVGEVYPKLPSIEKSVLGDFSAIWGGIAYMQNNTA